MTIFLCHCGKAHDSAERGHCPVAIDIPSAASLRDDLRATIATLTAERDAAVRERDEARSDAHIMGRCAEGFGPVLAELKAEHARELAEARRPGLTLTAEERAALRYGMAAIGHQEARFPIGSARAEEWKTAHAAIDRLLAGARTVTAEQVREWAECNVNASGWDELEHALVAFLSEIGIHVAADAAARGGA